jgi:outer membrane protein with beta-barrel domain
MRLLILAAACFGVVASVAPLQAQRPISFGLGGGPSLPQGDVDDQVNLGWHALVTAELASPMHPWGLRLDAAYSRFGFSDQIEQALGGEGHQTASSATLNFTYRLPKVTWPIQAYLLWGLGAYRTDCSLGPGCESRVRYGWNYGVGAKFFFLGLRNFVEIRGHRTKSRTGDVHYFPVTFGIMF